MYDLDASQELALWEKLLNKFRYDATAVMDIEENISKATKRMWQEEIENRKFALEMGYISEEEYYSWLADYRDTHFRKWSDEYNAATLELKAYSDSFFDSSEESLDSYESDFKEWLDYCVSTGQMSVDEQIDAWRRFADNYNAMVSNIVATTALGADEIDALWDKAYTVRRTSEKNIYSLSADKNAGTYAQWEKDMLAWVDIHNTYDDWDEIGDSLVGVYDRCIDRQNEFYENGVITWEQWKDGVRKYSLLFYEAVEEEYDSKLDDFADSIDALEEQFDAEIASLRESWEVEDRAADLKDVRAQLAIYKNASTDKGQEYYRQLLEREKQLEREEELYTLEVEQRDILDRLYAEYKLLETDKKKILAGIRNADLTTASHSGDISYSTKEIERLASAMGVDFAAVGYSSLDMLGEIYDVLKAIKKNAQSPAVYNDSRNISIESGLNQSAIATVINGTIVSTLGAVRIV